MLRKAKVRPPCWACSWLMFSFLQSSSAISKGTPQTSRKVYVFSKWLTQGDQIELVQKDMESAKRFRVNRHKLSGLEKEEGSLVVGVTAVTFLNMESRKGRMIFFRVCLTSDLERPDLLCASVPDYRTVPEE
jgi:hypothetical protein